jgi:hypothetical protein
MTDPATNTNNGSNGNDKDARQVRFSDQDIETGSEIAATATAIDVFQPEPTTHRVTFFHILLVDSTCGTSFHESYVMSQRVR